MIRVSSQDKEIKVTDKRMFTPEGELREEYRFLSEKSTGAAEAAPAAAPEPPPLPPSSTAAYPAPERLSEAPPPEILDDPAGPTFYDLVAVLAEPIPIYLGEMGLPDGQSAENLEMARLHIDLLDVLRQKTVGNLSAQESAFMEDLLYRMRVHYVQKTR